MPRLNKKFIEKTKCKFEKIFWDNSLKGFGLRVSPTGRKSFIINWRNQEGRQGRKVIGIYGKLTIEQARLQAKQYFYKISLGEEPRRNSNTNPSFAEFAKTYQDEFSYNNKSFNSYINEKYLLKNHILPVFGKKKLNQIKRRDIEKFHSGFPHMRVNQNRMLSLISHIYTKAIEWEYIEVNPAQGVRKKKEEKRSRYLSKEEINRLLAVLDSFPYKNVSQALKIILFTGSRRGEVLGATWNQFNFEKKIWIKPLQKTKQRRTEYIPINDETLAVLMEMKKTRNGLFLFPSDSKEGHMLDFKSSWKNICKLAKLEDVRVHDLRHTYASLLVNNGISLSVIGRLLGHSNVSTTARYAHLNDETLRNASNIIKFNWIIQPPLKGKVEKKKMPFGIKLCGQHHLLKKRRVFYPPHC